MRPYEVGRPTDDVARELGLHPDSIIKLTANESPDGPFPGVIEAATIALSGSNRYPDNQLWDVSRALAGELGVDRENLLFGNGSVALISDMLNAIGGQGTSVVYSWPSFVMYRFAAIWAGSKTVEVPLDDQHRVDLNALVGVIDETTTAVVVCNPNNPTGTIREAAEIGSFIEEVPDDVLVIVDEAYHEFVRDPRYETAIPLLPDRPNVVVLRTFSKIYSLAAHRVGVAIGDADTLAEFRKATQPLTVNSVAQAAVLATLGQPHEVERRSAANEAARHHLSGALRERGLEMAESHANFIFFQMPGGDSRQTADLFARRGVIIRPFENGWMRVTVGAEAENRVFLAALDEVHSELAD